MSETKYTVEGICPDCGKKTMLALGASNMTALKGADHAALASGAAPKAIAHCEACGKDYAAPISPDTCAEWDDFCNEIHPIQEV